MARPLSLCIILIPFLKNFVRAVSETTVPVCVVVRLPVRERNALRTEAPPGGCSARHGKVRIHGNFITTSRVNITSYVIICGY